MPVSRRYRTVVSASRRIDLVSCFPTELAERVAAIGAERIHTLVIWTKDPRNLVEHPALGAAIAALDAVYVHLTVTGLGGTEVEPRVRPWREVLQSMEQVLDLPQLRPGSVTLRYDPLCAFTTRQGRVLGNLEPALFSAVMEGAARLGIRDMRTSIMTPYGKLGKRFTFADLQPLPNLKTQAAAFIDLVMAPLCRKGKLTLRTCVVPDSGDAGCIDGRLLRELHPQQLPCSLARDRSQREGCACTISLDIGTYDACPHGCLYCYANPQLSPPHS